MSRFYALCGTSAIAVELALLASVELAHAQSSELPAVTVEAPKVATKSVAKKPDQQAAALRQRAPKPAEAPTLQHVLVNATDLGGVNASYATPPIVARYQLPQESYSITSKQIDETINLKNPENPAK